MEKKSKSMFNVLNQIRLYSNNLKKFSFFISIFLLFNSIFLIKVNGLCQFKGIDHNENTNWIDNCKNCTCIESVPFCEQIQCKYEPCMKGKILILNDDQCCPTCQEPKKSCNYDSYLINHNTEFSPKLCTTCKCKNGQMECSDNCEDHINNNDNQYETDNLQFTSLDQRKERLRQHHRNLKTRNNLNNHNINNINIKDNNELVKSICYHDNKIYQFNSTWSPLKCTQCKCNYNSVVDCYVQECPSLNCPHGVELGVNDCCPKCKTNQVCFDNGQSFKEGDYWTKRNDPCQHCTCSNGNIKCYKQTCNITSCPMNDVLVTKSNRCCPQCESQMSENCEYYGKIHYNGEMWYTNGCQHCACDSGRVICMNVQCESTFCLKDEIMVKKKDDCCIHCRKPMFCKVDNNLEIRENDFWIPNSIDLYQKKSTNPCKICQCIEGELVCFTKLCQNAKYPSFAHLNAYLNQNKEINARTIPFLADFIKGMNKESLVFVSAGPIHSNLYLDNKPITVFKLNDIAMSKIYYKIDSLEDISDSSEQEQHNDFIVLSLMSNENKTVHNVLIQLEIFKSLEDQEKNSEFLKNLKDESLLTRSIKNLNSERNIRGHEKNKNKNDKLLYQPRKTIFIQPGEAIKLTSSELKPKNLPSNVNADKLIYFLVSANPKYGELKLKKVFTSDDTVPLGWNKVNDLYLEKPVKDFTQNDLDNGNVWYEPYNDFSHLNNYISNCNKTNRNKIKKKLCLFGEKCSGSDDISVELDDDCNEEQISNIKSNSFSSDSSEAKYDHCMFEVYDQDKLNELISKEIIHFSIQNEVINETVLGLEVVENQMTPLTFSNFDIAGIDSSRDYLIYRIIKNLEKDQGQLEHANRPGVPIEIFTQHDLNKGLILYFSPKEIGINPREFFFTFVVTNDNRSDTFPETPFHVKVLPSNDQAPIFKEPVSTLNILQSGSLILSRELFDIDDPDSPLDNIIFTIEKPPDNSVVELRSKGQRYVIAKDDSFTIHEIRDGTFRLIHNGANNENDFFKVSVSDNKHVSIKTININVKLIDKIAPRVSDRSTMLLNIKEGQVKTIRRENLAFVDDRSSSEEIYYKLTSQKKSFYKRSDQSKLSGKLFNKDKILKFSSVFTQADIDLQNIRYEAPQEIGQNMLTDLIQFDVSDKEGNVIKDQIFTIKVEPVDNQAPIVDILQSIKVIEGGYLIINESYIQVHDIDSAKEQLNVIIDSQPSFGYLENIHKGTKLSSFPLVDLIDGLSIRYVQSDHQNKEPNLDSFIFHVSDGINESPTSKLNINIELVNDEKPVVIFEPLLVEFNKKATLTNSTFYIIDFDTKPDDLHIFVEEFPQHGKIFNLNNQLNQLNKKFSYSDVLKKSISYRLDDKTALKDEIMFKITDGLFSTFSKFNIKKMNQEKNAPLLEKNEGLQAIEGHLFPITSDILKSISRHKYYELDYSVNNIDKKLNVDYNFYDNTIIYRILKPPAFGKLQYRFDNFYQEIAGPHSFMNTFTQKDIDQGRVYYNHGSNEPTGVTSIKFNVSDSNENVLPDQRFIIAVRGDKLPPVFTVNKGLKVNQGQSCILSRYDLDVRDDDTLSQNLKFYIISQPKLGRLENTKEPGKRIDTFLYEDLVYNRIKYVHEEQSLLKSLYDDKKQDELIDLKVSDGKNDASTTFQISIVRKDNLMPILKSTFLLKLKELERKQITINELRVIDKDTPNDQLKIIITHPPQYGTLEKQISNIQTNFIPEKKIEDQLISINTNMNQKLNFILKFNNNNSNSRDYTRQNFMTINEFTMSDLEKGLIYYNHRSPGVRQDRFGFIVYDGFNNMFIIDGGIQVSAYQIFNIYIDMDKNLAPLVEKNIGLDYLNQIESRTGRLITKNELSIIDKDDPDTDLMIEITRKPQHGFVQNKDRPGIPLYRFTQFDINQNKIFYVLKNSDDSNIQEDYFEFDIYDVAKNFVKQNRFDIKWSMINFEENEVSVMESEGKVRVHIKKTGNLKQFSMVTCKTVSDSAKSNRDTKLFDFVHTHVRIEFNEDESYKACDVIINKDNQIEPIESFYIVLEDPKYSIIGVKNQIKVNILDKKKESLIEFEKVKFEVQESDKFISIPIIRSGDISSEVLVECLTSDESAISGLDFVPRQRDNTNSNIVRIPAGEIYGFCDIELIDDDLNELQNEFFKAYLSNPSIGSRIGSKSEAKILIIGPNDVVVNDCKTMYHLVNENDGKLSIDIVREKSNQNETLEVLIQNIATNDIYINSYLNNFSNKEQVRNLSIAEPNKDYEAVNQKIKFLPGEILKKFYINLLNKVNDVPRMFTIQIKPIVTPNPNLTICDYVNPDIVNIIIGEQNEDGVTVGFNQTSMFVNETSKLVSVPIIRSGDLTKPFSVICHTRQQTAIEDKDYIGKGSFEQSRIYFEPGEKIKYCNVEIINDSIFEADETFQIKLSDLRGSPDVRFNQYTVTTVTILNNEDSSVISLSEEIYYTEEPSSSDSSILKPITVIRTGDLSRTSLIRISTSDGSAKEGIDYKPKTEILKFNPGVSALDFEVEIFHDNEREDIESFKVLLGPQDPVSGVFGKIKSATVIIRDSNLLSNNTNSSFTQSQSFGLNSIISDSQIYLNSLIYHVLDQYPDYEHSTHVVPNGEPLICLEPCDLKNPNYENNKNLCNTLQAIDEKIKLDYAWEISTPNEFGVYSQFIKLIDNSLITFVNESILEPIYFQPKFRVRCTIKFFREYSEFNQENLKTLKSNYVQISENENEIISRIKDNKRCVNLWQDKTKEHENLNYTDNFSTSVYSKSLHLQSNLPIINFKFDKPFIARADYISAEFIKNNPNLVDVEYMNYIRLSIEIPYMEGILPLISTTPLYNYRHLLNGESPFSLNHICSNFIYLNKQDSGVKYGFVRNDEDMSDDIYSSNEWVELNEKLNNFRNNKTLKFYSNLDKEKCLWKFVAFYDITELTSFCQAQIVSSDSDPREDFYQSDKNNLIIKIPLYVSYLYASRQVSWTSIDYKTNVEASIIYRTNYNSENLNELSSQLNSFPSIYNNNNENKKYFNNLADQSSNKHLLSLTISKISMTENGKLIIEFSTVPSFYGQFVKYHPGLGQFESRIISPDDQNVKFNLDLVWSQYTYDYPEQTWKATSASVLNNYSGNYTIQLVPCYAKPGQAFKYPFDCEPQELINYTMPISVEQSTMPVPVKYSLGTRFTLSNNLINSINPTYYNNNFDGYFRKGDNIYGTIIWDADQDQKSVYKLELDKIYLCSSYKDFVPVYDPEGTIYNKGPQFGCSKPQKSLKHRILLLDRSSEINTSQVNYSTNLIKKSKFEAQFLNDLLNTTNYSKILNSEKLKKHLIIDGFKFNSSILFDIETYTNTVSDSKETIWFIQAMFYIRPSVHDSTTNSKQTRDLHSQINTYSLKDVFNNGTNMHMIRLTTDKKQVLLSHRTKYKQKNDVYLKQMKLNENKSSQHGDLLYVKVLVPVIILVIFILFAILSVVYWKRDEFSMLLFGRYKTTKSQNDEDQIKNEKLNINVKSANLVNSSQNNLDTSSSNNSSESKFSLLRISNLRKKFMPNIDSNLQKELINTSGENYSGTNSTSDTVVVVSPLVEQTNTKNLTNSQIESRKNYQSNMFPNTNLKQNEDMNSTVYSPSQINDEDDHYSYSKSVPLNVNIDQNEYDLAENCNNKFPCKKPNVLKDFLNKFSLFKNKNQNRMNQIRREIYNNSSSNGEYENFIDTNHNRYLNSNYDRNQDMITINNNQTCPNFPKYPTIKRNNYLYFNYNNNKMNYFNNNGAEMIPNDLIINEHDLVNELQNPTSAKLIITTTPLMTTETIAALSSMSSSTPTQITPVSSTTKCSVPNPKRLSGTEV